MQRRWEDRRVDASYSQELQRGPGVAAALQSIGWPRLLIVLSAALVSLPLLLRGPSCGHDFDFHLQSWLAVREAWRAGLASPHWVSGANYGAGEPRLLFYPPLSWLLGALLGAVLPWQTVPAAFTFLALTGAGLSLHCLASKTMPPLAATCAACAYLANPYLLFVAYERTAYGELLAAAWMPLLLLYALRPSPPWRRLSLVIATLWFTNAPAAVMGCYLLAFCALATAVAVRSFVPAARSLAALALGSGLAAVYLVPAWYEQRWVQIARAVDPGMRVEDSFLFAHTGQPYHDQVLHTASVLAVAMLGAGLACLAGRWLLSRGHMSNAGSPPPPPTPPTPDAEQPLTALLPPLLLALLLGIFLLLLPASNPLWRHAPELRFLQFPWRWLLVAGVAAALAAGALLSTLPGPQPPRRWLKPAASCALLVAAFAAGRLAQQRFAQPCDEEDNVTAQLALVAPNALNNLVGPGDPPGFEGTDEYTPTGADNGEIQQGLPAARLLLSPEDDEGDDATTPNPDWQSPAKHVASGRLTLDRWSPEHRRLTVRGSEPAYLVLRLMDYPAWQVSANGKAITARPHREDGLLTLPIAPGVTTIEIDWRATPDVLAGRTVSLLSLLALAALSLLRTGPRTLRGQPQTTGRLVSFVYDQRE